MQDIPHAPVIVSKEKEPNETVKQTNILSLIKFNLKIIIINDICLILPCKSKTYTKFPPGDYTTSA